MTEFVATTSRSILITGGSGYIGRPLIAALLARGHKVRALVREASVKRVSSGATAGATIIVGDALNAESIASALCSGDTLVQLVGTSHPSPSKAQEFIRVDLASVRAAVTAAQQAGVAHFIYLSVAQPAPVMEAYVAVRATGETIIRNAGLAATFLRPWYVLGPGHRWPLLLMPLYAIAKHIPSLRDGASRLGLVSLPQMVNTLLDAVEHPPQPNTARIVDVPQIRAGRIL